MKLKNRLELIFALLAAVTGLFLLAGTVTIATGAGYDRIGPRFFPFLVAAGLVITGVSMIAGVLRRPGEPVVLPLDTGPLALLAGALVLTVVLLEPLGFILTAVLLFWLAARAFRSRYTVRDAVVGLVLSLLVYFAFTLGLGLALPRGVLAGLI